MVSDDEKLKFVRDHCPKTTFHPQEHYFPCSIEHLLRNSTLKKRARHTQDLESVKVNPSADELGNVADDHSDYFLEIAASQLRGCIPAERAIDAPIYAALVETDGAFVDVYYISLYAFQGSGTYRCCAKLGHKYNVIAHEFGRHQGDVEHCIVRTDLAFSRVLSVGYEAHDKIAWFFPGDYPEDNGHPLVYASLLNHASYFFNAPTPMPKGGTGDAHSDSQQQWAKTGQYAGVLEPIDLIERHPHSGVWQPYLQHHNVIIVSKDNPSTKWVRYAGYLGIPLGTPKFTGATEVWHAPLGVVAKLYTDVIAKMAEVLKVTRSCDPTRGLGARHYIKHPYVSNWQHVQALSAPHLVLSVNPHDLNGPLIMAPVQDGDPHQLWHQDHWRQFGNPRITECIKGFKPVKEVNHVEKEACVLISKSTGKLLCCGGRDQRLCLVDYARGADVIQKVTLDLAPQPSPDDSKYYAVRPVCDTCLNWTIVGANVCTSAWSSGAHQAWKLGHCKSAQEVARTAESAHAEALYSDGSRELAQGSELTSRHRTYVLCMQHDGNLVIYKSGNAIWATNTCNKGCGPYCLVMQEDRNLVVYGNGSATWSTNTHGRGKGPARLVIQEDGNLVVYDADGHVLWARC